MKCFLILVFVFFAPSVAVEQVANTSDGNDLLPRCQAMIASNERPTWKDSHESFSAGFCEGLVEGITIASPSVCAPKGATVTQAIRVVVKYLEDNPEKLNLHEATLVEQALAKAFPCQHK